MVGEKEREIEKGTLEVGKERKERKKRKKVSGKEKERKEILLLKVRKGSDKRKRGTVRGVKRRRGLPVRGQRTQTNGKTARKLNGRRR